jgi:hypothetical protein
MIRPLFIGFEMESPFTEELSGFKYLNVIGYAPTDEPVTVSEGSVSVLCSLPVLRAERSSEARLGELSTRCHGAVPCMCVKHRAELFTRR